MNKENSLIEQYYSSIVDIMDLEQIDTFLPEYSYYAFFRIMEGLIQRLKDYYKELNELLLSDTEQSDLSLIEEYEITAKKIEICEKKYQDAIEKENAEELFYDENSKHIIYATRGDNCTYLESDLSSIPEEEYYKIIQSINELVNGIRSINIEKDRRFINDATVKDLFEKKSFRIRVLYKIIDSDSVFLIMVKQKKQDNSKLDKEVVKVRNKSTVDEYVKIKKIFETNEEEKNRIIELNDVITRNVLEYLNENKRGVKNGQQETGMCRK